MGRAPCCSKVGLHRGPWTPREDILLINYIQAHGEGKWRSLPKKAGLLRCGKSCRLRWMNYLRPDIKRGNVTPDEEDLIIRMHSLLGNRWSLIAGRLPGRTDNEIKNYWNTHLRKKLKSQGTDPITHKKLAQAIQQKGKRRKKNDTANSNNSKNKNKAKSEPEKPKVHLPKPVRLITSFCLPSNTSFECNTNSASSSQGGKVVENSIPLCNFNESDDGISFLVGDVDHDLVNGSDHLQGHNNNLEKMYDEYLQLLKVDDNDQVQLDDSFAEAFLL